MGSSSKAAKASSRQAEGAKAPSPSLDKSRGRAKSKSKSKGQDDKGKSKDKRKDKSSRERPATSDSKGKGQSRAKSKPSSSKAKKTGADESSSTRDGGSRTEKEKDVVKQKKADSSASSSSSGSDSDSASESASASASASSSESSSSESSSSPEQKQSSSSSLQDEDAGGKGGKVQAAAAAAAAATTKKKQRRGSGDDSHGDLDRDGGANRAGGKVKTMSATRLELNGEDLLSKKESRDGRKKWNSEFALDTSPGGKKRGKKSNRSDAGSDISVGDAPSDDMATPQLTPRKSTGTKRSGTPDRLNTTGGSLGSEGRGRAPSTGSSSTPVTPGAFLMTITDDAVDERPEIVRGAHKEGKELRKVKKLERRQRKDAEKEDRKEKKRELKELPKDERKVAKKEAKKTKRSEKKVIKKATKKRTKRDKTEKVKHKQKGRRKKVHVLPKRNKAGETIFKDTPSWELMIAIQTAIRYSVGKSAILFDANLRTEKQLAEEAKRDRFWKSTPLLRFPQVGSALTPSHTVRSFKFKDYCPLPFRHLRQKFGVDTADYLVSLCNTLDDGSNALREMGSPGKSGSLFMFSHDMKYILKTIPKREAQILLDMLPDYYRHVMKYPHTLLPKFYGLHRFKPHHGRQVRLVVMGNVFLTHKKIHRKYDLKGSKLGRAVSEQEKKAHGSGVVYKDLDWDEQGQKLMLGPERRAMFLQQLQEDVNFLKRARVMDYSLLVGVHDRNQADSLDATPDSSSMYDTHSETDSEGSSAMEPREVRYLPGEDSSSSSSGMNLPDTSSGSDSDQQSSRGSSGSAGQASKRKKGSKKPSKSKKKASRRDRDSSSEDSSDDSGRLSSETTSDFEDSEEMRHAVPRDVVPEVVSDSDTDNSSTIEDSQRSRYGKLGAGRSIDRFGSLRQTSMLMDMGDMELLGTSIFEADAGGMRAHGKHNEPLDENYFVGVIDILMNYTARKKAERQWKLRRFGNELAISSIEPGAYGDRFFNYCKEITK